MAMWFLFVFIILGVLLAIRIYTYENSEFRKITEYSLLHIWTNNDIKHTYKFVQSLRNLQGEYKLLLNLALPEKNGKRKIDAVVIHPSGIYVFNLQNHSGWIYGREKDEQWAHAAFKKDELIPFNNPIIELKNAVLNLKNRISIEKNHLYRLVVLFSDQCAVKKIMISSKNVSVLKVNELKDFWKLKKEQILTTDEVNRIYQSLTPFVEVSNPSMQKKIGHVANH